ncbi:MAG: tetratricopeptide repeat protein [Myxococcota bacterium]
MERRAYRLGRRSFERGDVDTALSQLGSLLETRRDFADVHYMMGVLRERKDELPEAAESLRRALRINPSYAEALLALANVYELLGDFGRSQEVNERAKIASGPAQGALDPTTRGKLANLQAAVGDAYREAGELNDAIEAYRKALDRCPDFHDIRCRLGVALRDACLPDRALVEFRRVLRGRPDYLDAAVQLGVTLYSLGRSEEAVSEWIRVVERDPSRRDARMYLRLVRGRPSEG